VEPGRRLHEGQPGLQALLRENAARHAHKAFLAGKLQNIPQYAHPFETVQTLPGRLTDPLGWRKPSRVFVNSMSDLFHEDVPDDFLDAVFAVMAIARQHTFQVLTKRPARMREYINATAGHESIYEQWSRVSGRR
jgi:protein gp37